MLTNIHRKLKLKIYFLIKTSLIVCCLVSPIDRAKTSRSMGYNALYPVIYIPTPGLFPTIWECNQHHLNGKNIL